MWVRAKLQREGENPVDHTLRTIALRLWTVCLGLFFLLPDVSHAQSVMVGDIEIHPQDFASHQDPQTRVAPCLACHGKSAGGDADFGPDVRFGTPALRGLRKSYLRQSLIDYKEGKRAHEEMHVIASMLDAESIEFMARAFAAYPAAPSKTADDLARLAEKDLVFRKGQVVALEGRPDEGVPACMDCHGALGQGDPDLGPRLSGQNGLYIQQQLKAYADGSRQSEQAEIMQPVGAGLSAEDIEAVANYYENLIRADGP